ncbi:hypothetical protein L3Q82_023662, partial [Scortum barcoo]
CPSMSSSHGEYSLRHMSSLMGSRRQKAADDGEQSLIGDPGGDLVDQDASTPVFVYVLAFFSALGGFLFGYDTGVVSGAMLLLKKEMNLNTLWQELLVSSTVGAAALSALGGGSLNGWLGRRACILLPSQLHLQCRRHRPELRPGQGGPSCGQNHSWFGHRFFNTDPQKWKKRGIASMTVPVYIAEVSPPHQRGQLVTINSLFITGGQFIASVIDGAFSYLSHDGWRYMLGLSVVPAALQFVGFFFLPESPRWLLQKGRRQEARQVLNQIRRGQSVDEEYDTIRTSIEEEEKEAGGGGLVILRILRHGPTRRALIVGCGLQMFQQLSGINTVMYYSATILQMAGVRDDKQAIWLAAATSATNFVFTLVGVWLVERVGRRKLTLGSLLGLLLRRHHFFSSLRTLFSEFIFSDAGTSLSLTLLAVGFLLSAQNSPPITLHPVDPQNSTCRLYGSCELCMLDPDCGFCYRENGTEVYDSSCVPVYQASTDHAAWGRSDADCVCGQKCWCRFLEVFLPSRCSNQTEAADSPIWAYNYCPTSYSWIVLMGLISYLAFFAPGMGPMPWTVNSEIYPLWARSTGNACSAGVNWIFNVLVSLTFLHIAEFLTYYGAFFMYTGLAVLGLLFVQGCLPETQGLQLEDIENLFSGQLCSCGASSPSDNRHVHYIRVKGNNYLPSDNDASDTE